MTRAPFAGRAPARLALAVVALLAAAACRSAGDAAAGSEPPGAAVEGACELAEGAPAPDSLRRVGCTADFVALASTPLDTSLPGARSVKVILDQSDGDRLWFQNSARYRIHHAFASTHLSGNGRPIVPGLAAFNTTEYFAPDRRFLLGAVTWYEGPKVWALELAPYDTASVAQIAKLHAAVKTAAFFGPPLRFHPTSADLETRAAALPPSVPVSTTAALYEGIAYQPLNLASGVGRLRFLRAADLPRVSLSWQDLVVLDLAPGDLPVVQGIVTEEFQTPLSHLNVLSRNRHTPNMGLRNALSDARLRALEGRLVRLTVGASAWSVTEVGEAEAEAFWAAHAPPPVTLPAMDLTVTDLLDVEHVASEAPGGGLRDAIRTAVGAFGGKAAHYAVLARTPGVPVKKAFAIPVSWYHRFMVDNGFFDRVEALLADASFKTDQAVRAARLAQLRADMQAAPVDPTFQALLRAKLEADHPGCSMRFRTSTNSEDLDGFPCAGCYESHTGNPAKGWDHVLDAIRETYASAWLLRTFEERAYYGVDHRSVGMALLVHRNFPDEEANGVAVTANPFDATGLDPAFYVNVQSGGEYEVVEPVAGVRSDELLYHFGQPNQPVSYLGHSSLVPAGATVLDRAQLHALGTALDAIHARFSAAYGPAAGNRGWYAMDVEFKLDDEAAPGQPPALYVKQARPYPRPAE